MNLPIGVSFLNLLVCRYARSLGIGFAGSPKYTSDWRCLLSSKWYIISTPAQFSYTIDRTGADGPRSEGGRRVLLDNSSRVYVRFIPFVSGRVHLTRISDHRAILNIPLEPRDSTISGPISRILKKISPVSKCPIDIFGP